MEKLDEQKDITNDTPFVPKETIDLTAPPEYKEMPKRKKETSTSHPLMSNKKQKEHSTTS